MSLEIFLNKVKNQPETVQFNDSITEIDKHYDFSPTEFDNGNLKNLANENNGSCKILAFAQLHQLPVAQTLHLFGHYYRQEVLEDPDGDSHQNIRNFIQKGWDGIQFHGEALSPK